MKKQLIERSAAKAEIASSIIQTRLPKLVQSSTSHQDLWFEVLAVSPGSPAPKEMLVKVLTSKKQARALEADMVVTITHKLKLNHP